MFSKARKGTVITHLCSSFSLLQKAGFGFGVKKQTSQSSFKISPPSMSLREPGYRLLLHAGQGVPRVSLLQLCIQD